jgi:cholesterol transport system auxiliary component
VRAAVVGRIAVVALLAAVAAGCLTKPALVPQSFSIDPPAPRSDTSADGVVLTLARVDVAPPYSGQALVYRIGEHGFERDPYARFTAPPGWLLTAAIRGYLANADFVRDVVAPGDRARSEAAIQVAVLQLAGELRGSDPSAVLTLRFRVLSGPTTRERPEILLKTYSKTIPIPYSAARDVVDAWNKGLAEIMAEFQADLQTALTAAASATAR